MNIHFYQHQSYLKKDLNFVYKKKKTNYVEYSEFYITSFQNFMAMIFIRYYNCIPSIEQTMNKLCKSRKLITLVDCT